MTDDPASVRSRLIPSTWKGKTALGVGSAGGVGLIGVVAAKVAPLLAKLSDPVQIALVITFGVVVIVAMALHAYPRISRAHARAKVIKAACTDPQAERVARIVFAEEYLNARTDPKKVITDILGVPPEPASGHKGERDLPAQDEPAAPALRTA